MVGPYRIVICNYAFFQALIEQNVNMLMKIYIRVYSSELRYYAMIEINLSVACQPYLN